MKNLIKKLLRYFGITSYFKVRNTMLKNKFGVFDKEHIEYWYSLPLFRKVKLAVMSDTYSRRLTYQIFEKPKLDNVANIIAFYNMENAIKPELMKIIKER